MTVVKCPTCKKEVLWSSAPFRPFCCERCKLIDLGAWADGSYAVPGEPAPHDRTEPTPHIPQEEADY